MTPTRLPLELLPLAADGTASDAATFVASRRHVLARHIRTRMAELDIRTQRQLRERTGLARGTIARVLAGEPSSAETYYVIARALGLSFEGLVAAPTRAPRAEDLDALAAAYQRAPADVQAVVRRLLLGEPVAPWAPSGSVHIDTPAQRLALGQQLHASAHVTAQPASTQPRKTRKRHRA